MPEELQNLLERIQKDGVDKAEAEAGRIVSEAKKSAQAIKAEAEEAADAAMKKAELDGKAFIERGRKSLEQAARDVILSVGDAVSSTMVGIVDREVSQALTGDTLKKMLTTVVELYCKKKSGSTAIDILLNAEQQQEIVNFFMSKYAEAVRNGLEIKADGGIVSGFRVSVADEKVEHDFSGEAITEALCQLLRPHLAEIVRESAKKA